jgi:cytochrome c5
MLKRRRVLVAVAAAVWFTSIFAGGLVAAQRAADVARNVSGLPAGEGSETLRTSCTTCHGTDLIVQQRLSREGWSRELDKMIGWGAVIASGEQSGLLNYLTSNFGVDSSRPAIGPAENGAALLKTRCQTCHDLRLIEQQRLDQAGWTREIDKMIGWGAELTNSDKETLSIYLSGGRHRGE